jgi:hypothetical protein
LFLLTEVIVVVYVCVWDPPLAIVFHPTCNLARSLHGVKPLFFKQDNS